jgi:Phosphotransferase enzyme family
MPVMSDRHARVVTLVLCTPQGELLGALPEFVVASQWWRQVDDVVAEARRAHGIEVRVLRVLTTHGPCYPGGGPVSYLAEVDEPVTIPLKRWLDDPLADHPLRLPSARPGGHLADLAWAKAVLCARGIAITDAPQQIRTWNLSSIWRLPITGGDAWLKVVPPFLAHEAAVVPRLDPEVGPPVLGASRGRLLLRNVPGDDQYDATQESLLEMVRMLVRLQAGWIDRTDELLTWGLHDLRPAALMPRIRTAVDRHRDELNPAERGRIDALVDGLPARFADLAACGLPDTLVHGDFHPGNVRGLPGAFTILDWGDSAVGHPMFDQLAFGRRIDAADRTAAERLWVTEWQRVIARCDAGRAAALLRPVAALYGAVVYDRFLDNIEPDEHRYHEGDSLASLRHAADLAGRRGTETTIAQ